MRLTWMVIASVFALAGCLGNGSDPASDGQDGDDAAASDREGYRDGVVLLNEEFTASTTTPATFEVTFEEGAREVILEIQQDSGVMPNLHVEVEGCGGTDTPASAAWQSYPLCDEPQAGRSTVTISVKAGAPAGTGRFLLRADLPG